MPIRELSDFLSDVSTGAKNGKRVFQAGKRAAQNLRRMGNEERLSLGKRALGEALLYATDVLCGPEIRAGEKE